MTKIREQIIHKSTHEAEKNKFIFFNEIDHVKVYSTHAKVWVVDRTDEDGNLQPVLLLHCDSHSMPANVKRDYGVLILTPNASRYSEAVGILVRKTYSSFTDKAVDQGKKIVENIKKTRTRLLGVKL